MANMFHRAALPAGPVHVEFKAGRMEWDGRVVTADKRKGKVTLFTSEEEELMHFQWLDRDKNEVALDLIILNDAYLEKVEKCATGRVYLLRFSSSDKKLFFWMQEPKADGDDEFVRKFNEAIDAKIPDKTKSSTAGVAAPKAAAGPLGAPGAAAPKAAAGPLGAPGSAGAEIDPQLQALLQQFFDGQAQQQGRRAPPVPLTAVLTPEALQSLMGDEAAETEMMALLPEGYRSQAFLRQALGSPQLQQCLRALTQAVHSDQLPILFASLGLDPAAIAAAAPGADALEVLCRAMQGGGASAGGTGAGPGGAGDAGSGGGAA